jgi:hypothetical protein
VPPIEHVQVFSAPGVVPVAALPANVIAPDETAVSVPVAPVAPSKPLKPAPAVAFTRTSFTSVEPTMRIAMLFFFVASPAAASA